MKKTLILLAYFISTNITFATTINWCAGPHQGTDSTHIKSPCQVDMITGTGAAYLLIVGKKNTPEREDLVVKSKKYIASHAVQELPYGISGTYENIHLPQGTRFYIVLFNNSEKHYKISKMQTSTVDHTLPTSVHFTGDWQILPNSTFTASVVVLMLAVGGIGVLSICNKEKA